MSPLTPLRALLTSADLPLPEHLTTEHLGELGDLLGAATTRWGLGLHHMRHLVTLDGDRLLLHADRSVVGHADQPPAELRRAYNALSAPDERGLSAWPVLGEGPRTPWRSAKQFSVIIEDARDFETDWIARKDTWWRAWRQGETLTTELSRPVDPAEQLSDAAWAVITTIKDRALQREIITRSEQSGMLGAYLSARHPHATDTLNRQPEPHFTVTTLTTTLTGEDARNHSALLNALRTLEQDLSSAQERAEQRTADLLRGDLR